MAARLPGSLGTWHRYITLSPDTNPRSNLAGRQHSWLVALTCPLSLSLCQRPFQNMFGFWGIYYPSIHQQVCLSFLGCWSQSLLMLADVGTDNGGNRLVTMLQLCESLTMANQNFFTCQKSTWASDWSSHSSVTAQGSWTFEMIRTTRKSKSSSNCVCPALGSQ